MQNPNLPEIIQETEAKKVGTEYLGKCPAHFDKHASLSIRENPNSPNPLVYCHTGCTHEQIAQSFTDKDLWISSDKSMKLGADTQLLDLYSKGVQIQPNGLGGIYFASRSISLILPTSEAKYVDSLYYDKERSYPALLFPLRDKSNQIRGLQRIYLNSVGRKAPVDTPKKVLGKIKGNSIKFGDITYSNTLHLAEGIETALSIRSVLNEPVWASCNANNLSNTQIPKQVTEVHIWADNDKSQTGQKEALKAAETFQKQFKTVFIHLPQRRS